MHKLSGKNQLKTIIFLFPIVAFLLFFSVKIVSKSTYGLIVQEDSVVEYVQAAAYFVSSIFSFLISIRFLRRRKVVSGVLYLILFFGFVFICLEEISWAQRIFNIAPPTYFEKHNYQEEISVHNLPILQDYVHGTYILVGLFGTCAWMLIPRRLRAKGDCTIKFFVPDWFLSSYFFFVLIIYTYFELIRSFDISVLGMDCLQIGVFFVWRDQEPAELLLSLGFLLFVMINSVRQARDAQHSVAPVRLLLPFICRNSRH